MWTGDNSASFDFLRLSMQMCLTISISGHGFCGADVGGFTGKAYLDLLVKWYQAAIFQPFFRAHAHKDVQDRDPFLVLPEAFKIIKKFVKLRL